MRQLQDLIFITLIIGIILTGAYVLFSIPSHNEIYQAVLK